MHLGGAAFRCDEHGYINFALFNRLCDIEQQHFEDGKFGLGAGSLGARHQQQGGACRQSAQRGDEQGHDDEGEMDKIIILFLLGNYCWKSNGRYSTCAPTQRPLPHSSAATCSTRFFTALPAFVRGMFFDAHRATVRDSTGLWMA